MGINLFDTLITFLKELFEKVNFEKVSRHQKSMQKFPAIKEFRPQNMLSCNDLQPLDHDHGQTDSRAQAQRLSAAHHKVTWSILIGLKYSTARAKQRLPCVKRKVTVYVTCQCFENRCFWRVIDHKYQAPCCVAWCTVLFRSI